MASLFAGGGVAFQFSFKQSALRNIYCVWRGVDSQYPGFVSNWSIISAPKTCIGWVLQRTQLSQEN